MPDIVITFLASFLVWFLFGGLFYFFFVNRKMTSSQLIQGIAAALFAFGLSEILKEMFPMARPFVQEGIRPLTLTVPTDGTFPSSHAAVSFGLASGVWVYDKKTGAALMMGAILVSLGRVLSNAHYFIDVFGGAYLGLASGFLINKLHSVRS